MKVMETPQKKNEPPRTSIADLQVGDLVVERLGSPNQHLVVQILPLEVLDDDGINVLLSIAVEVEFMNVNTKRRHSTMYTKGTHIHNHYYLISRTD
jgi:hypothetical protein